MNNQELEKRIKEILEIDNFFDMIEAARAFEKEYKTSDFYKITKMNLSDVIKNSKQWYLFSFKELGSHLQDIINNLSLDHLNELIEQIGVTFEKENQDTLQTLNNFKDLVKAD